MNTIFILYSLFVVSTQAFRVPVTELSNITVDPVTSPKLWAEAAYKWIHQLDCVESEEYLCKNYCDLVTGVNKSDYRVYATELLFNVRYGMVLLHSFTPKYKTFSDGILALDPFPNARFGHPILIFKVNFNKSKSCSDAKGILADDGSCLQPITTNFNNVMPYIHPTNCAQVLFLPLIHMSNELPVQTNDRLKCLSHIEGFHQSCPVLRSVSETSQIFCGSSSMNQPCSLPHNSWASRCVADNTCDKAILLSGGWNRQLSDVSTYNNIMNVKNMLMLRGFEEENIKLFYANGKASEKRGDDFPEITERENEGNSELDDDSEEDSSKYSKSYYPSLMKTAIRNQIKSICDDQFHTDTFFIYLNNPATVDGSSLLWDRFDDGIYQVDEIYSTKELLKDVSECSANRVIIMADQSYGGAVVAAAEARFYTLQNVVIFTSAKDFNLNSIADLLTKRITHRSQSSNICLQHFRNTFYKTNSSSPVYIGSKLGLLNSTLIGAACSNEHMFLNDPEKMKYRS